MDALTTRNKIYAYILCNVIAGLLCYAQINANALLIYGSLMAFLMLVGYYTTKNFALPVLLFFLPWCKILRISPDSFSFFTFALTFVCAINFVLRRFRLKRYQITAGIILAAMTLLAKLLHGGALSMNYIMFLVMLVLFPSIKEERKNKTYDFFILVIFLASGVVVASLYAQWFAGYGNIERFIRVDSYLTITRRCGFYGDPNFYNAQVTAAIAGCVTLILQIKDKKKVILLGILTAVLIYCGLLSGSKSFVLVFLGILVLWLYQLWKIRGRWGMKVVLVIGLVGFIIYASTSALFGGLIDVIVTRLSNSGNASDFTTGRTELWAMYLETILTDWRIFLLGMGYTDVFANGFASHNTILQMWFQLGILGSVPLVYWFVNFVRSGVKEQTACRGANLWILLIGVFLPWLAIDMLYFDEFFLFPMYVIVGLLDLGMGEAEENVHPKHVWRFLRQPDRSE